MPYLAYADTRRGLQVERHKPIRKPPPMHGLAESLALTALALIGAALSGYVLSVMPHRLARGIGPRAYRLSARIRLFSVVAFALSLTAMVLARLTAESGSALRVGLPCPRWVAVVAALPLATSAVMLMATAIRHAGMETLAPRADGSLFGGVYRRFRHPQSLGALLSFWALAMGLDSAFLLAVAAMGVPVWLAVIRWEECDLVLRFGDAYREYRRQVGLLGIERALGRSKAGGSWRR